jgi:hypothetical protein
MEYIYLSVNSIFQSISYGSYHDFLDRGMLLTRMLLNQGFLVVKLNSLLQKFYSHYHDLVSCYGLNICATNDYRYVPFVVIIICSYHWVCNRNNKKGATCGAETAYSSVVPEFTPGF